MFATPFETNLVFEGQQYVLDENVNLRDDSNLNSNIIGRLNKGDAVRIIENTNVSVISENIKDYFYKVETTIGAGYVFGGYISDISENINFFGKNYIFFSKQFDIKYLFPEKISHDVFYSVFHRMSDNEQRLIRQWYDNTEDREFFVNNYFIESFEVAQRLDVIMSKYFSGIEKSRESNFTKVTFYAKGESEIIEKTIYSTIVLDIKIYNNIFEGTGFIGFHRINLYEAGSDDIEVLFTVENGKFIEKRRLAFYGHAGRYQTVNEFIFPNEINGKNNIIIIRGRRLVGDDDDEVYEVDLVWNGKEFIEP